MIAEMIAIVKVGATKPIAPPIKNPPKIEYKYFGFIFTFCPQHEEQLQRRSSLVARFRLRYPSYLYKQV